MSGALTKPRIWVLGTAVVCVLLVIASYFFLIEPKRAEAAELQQQKVDVDSSNSQLEVRIAELQAQFAELPQRQAELAAIQQAMPEDAALPTLVRDLDALATASGVTLMTVSPGEPAAVTSLTDPAAAAAAPAGGEGAPEGEGATEGAADPAAQQPAHGDGSVLISIPANVVVVGDFFKAQLFLKKVQAEMKRAYLVTNLTVQAEEAAEASGGKPATENGHVTMTLDGSVFALRQVDTSAATVDPAASDAAPVDSAATDASVTN